MNRTREELLMRCVDGEVTDAEADEVARLLEESAEARALFRDFEVVGGVLRGVRERDPRGDDIAEAVMARLAPAPAPRRRARVSTLVSAGGLALAAAAAVMLYFRAPAVRVVPTVAVGSSASAETAPATRTAVAPSSNVGDARLAAAGPGEGTGAEIQAVDFGGNDGTIFMVDDDGPGVTPVVWLMDDSPATEDRMAPL